MYILIHTSKDYISFSKWDKLESVERYVEYMQITNDGLYLLSEKSLVTNCLFSLTMFLAMFSILVLILLY